MNHKRGGPVAWRRDRASGDGGLNDVAIAHHTQNANAADVSLRPASRYNRARNGTAADPKEDRMARSTTHPSKRHGRPTHERKVFRLSDHHTALIDETAKRFQVTESDALRRLLDELIERRVTGAGRKSA